MGPTPLRVFISYSHADNEHPDPSKRYLDRLLQILEPLRAQDQVSVWSDKDIESGADWGATIQNVLDNASAAVLLVSPAFLASKYIHNSELPVLLKRSQDRGLTIIPVILRPCLFEQTRFKYPDPVHGPDQFSLAALQAANSPKTPINSLTEYEQDKVFESVADRLIRIIQADAGTDRTTNADSSGAVPRTPRSDVNKPPRVKFWRRSRFLLLSTLGVLLIALALGLNFHRQLFNYWYILRHSHEQVPLTSSMRLRLATSIKSLQSYLQSEFDKRGTNRDYFPWTVAQITAAIGDQKFIDKNKATGFLLDDKWMSTSCWCWKEYPQDRTDPPSIAVTGWVIFALARVDVPASSDQIQSLLSHQDPAGGWWPSYYNGEKGRSSDASTYATSWAMMALSEQLHRNLIPPELREKVTPSLKAGSFWLRNTANGPARWSDYPSDLEHFNRESTSLSGLALHVLHKLDRDNITPPPGNDIDQAWLSRIQSEKIDGFDESYHVSTLEDGSNKKDSTRQFRLPWLLVGTVDAYSSGAWQAKERTIRRIGEVLAVVDQRIKKRLAPYEAAELLLALRYLEGDLTNREAI